MSLPAGLHLEKIDPRLATDAWITAFTRYTNALKRERSPNDPPITESQIAGQMRNIPGFVEVHVWAVFDGELLIADAHVALLHMSHNQHLTEANISVLPGYRRRGIAKSLFQSLVDVVSAQGRSLMLFNTNDRVPAGAACLTRLGAQAGLESHVNELDLQELDVSLLDSWIAQAQEHASAYELLYWDDDTPEEHLLDFVQLNKVMNGAPRGTLNVEDWEVTPEQARAWEAQSRASGRLRCLTVARHRTSGRLVGFSDLSWHPDQPSILSQGGTGVLTEARGFGLGRWMKAANLRRALGRVHDARFVRTTNADVNAAMLAINHALGFKPYYATTHWQLPLEQAQTYLASELIA